ncbi:pilus assembly protein [Thermoleophilia bacterium SCSIO 60948]|nr:pilus assembly protein [Thermoleophilia bacterium SCSIO 60948]
MSIRCGEGGQASVELIAVVPALLLAGLIGLQMALAGLSWSHADSAVEAGALAAAGGGEPEAAVRSSLPGWAREGAEIEADGGEVRLRLEPPSIVPGLGDALAVEATAWARPDGSLLP